MAHIQMQLKREIKAYFSYFCVAGTFFILFCCIWIQWYDFRYNITTYRHINNVCMRYFTKKNVFKNTHNGNWIEVFFFLWALPIVSIILRTKFEANMPVSIIINMQNNDWTHTHTHNESICKEESALTTNLGAKELLIDKLCLSRAHGRSMDMPSPSIPERM